MIDIHCHIIPNVDDGSDSLQASVMMAALAADNGIKKIVATPHVTWRNGISSREYSKIPLNFGYLTERIKESSIPVELILGAEVLCVDLSDTDRIKDAFPRIANTDYSLVEFYFETKLKTITEHLDILASKGITPVIAHPERYYEVQKDKRVLNDWFSKGYLLQINKGSLLGSFGKKEKAVADWTLENNMASFVATDSHNISGRSPRMSSAKDYIHKKFGSHLSEMLTKTNPELLLNNLPIRNKSGD